MGLFDKKNCDICGDKIGLLGNRKLDDGNLCKNCAAKLSPWFEETKGLFTVARRLNEEENPDIVPLSAVTSCRLEIKEEREEEEYQDQNGESRSYVPPRYHYSYDYKIKLSVNTPWFDDMDFQLNTFSVEGHERNKIMQYEQLGNQIVSALTGAPAPTYGNTMNQGYPQQGSMMNQG